MDNGDTALVDVKDGEIIITKKDTVSREAACTPGGELKAAADKFAAEEAGTPVADTKKAGTPEAEAEEAGAPETDAKEVPPDSAKRKGRKPKE